MTTRNNALRELGAFLKDRRGVLSPEELGVRDYGGRRRVAGLRREEVAQLLAISPDYYTRLEQGRLAPSSQVLAALVRVLRLAPEQSDYVRHLVEQASQPTGRRRTLSAASPQLRRVMNQLTETPALVFGPRLDILAWTPLAAALLMDFSLIPAEDRNYVRLVFTHPLFRELYPEWEAVAHTAVAVLRMDAASHGADPALSRLVGDLSISSPEFRSWWAERHVANQDFGTKTIRNPEVGELRLNWDSFRYSGDPEQQLVLWSADEGSRDEARLRELARRIGAAVSPPETSLTP